MATIPVSDIAKLQVRKIQNIEIHYDDLHCLIEPGHKVPGATMNAFGAALQELDETESSVDYAVLSSYLGVIVSQTSSETARPIYGSLEDHILAAVSWSLSGYWLHTHPKQCTSASPQELLSCTRWIIPLCGGSLAHWVLGWANFSTREMGIFDSLPEAHSETWAQPV